MTGPARDSERRGAAVFTVVGSRDPQDAPGGRQGPALDLIEALLYRGIVPEEVLIGWTPGTPNRSWPAEEDGTYGYDRQCRELQAELRRRLPDARLKTFRIGVQPNLPSALLPSFTEALAPYRQGDGMLHINTSSGTPQMQEVLKLLRGTGWLPVVRARLWQIDHPEFRTPNQTEEHHTYASEAVVPLVEEKLRLVSAFSTLRRFDFAGAGQQFRALAEGHLELPERPAPLRVMADISDALQHLDDRNPRAAAQGLEQLERPVAALVPLRQWLNAAKSHPADELVWLTWSKVSRILSQRQVADTLIWVPILHELMVVKLGELNGVPNEKKLTKTQLKPGVFEQLCRELPYLISGSGSMSLKNRDLKHKLSLLASETISAPNARLYNSDHNPDLHSVRELRNVVVHAGAIPPTEVLTQADRVVLDLLKHFPFQSSWGKAWAALPDSQALSEVSLVSATSFLKLIDDLEAWVG